jgi:uncharacterized membrane protein
MRVKLAGLGLVFGALAFTLALGGAAKASCASGNWGDLRQYRHLCYSDVVPLYGTENLSGSRLPYIDSCQGQCDEYPVLTMYAMRLGAWFVGSYSGFFYANVLLLSIAAFVTGFVLWRMAGPRALYFCLAPTLLIYAFVNWDLLAVAFAAAATFAFVRRRDGPAGVLLGLGTAAKFFPALLLVPFAAERLRTRELRRAGSLVWWAVWAWLIVDAPFIVLAPHSWSQFFRFNTDRIADFDSLWYIACDRLHGRACVSTNWINRYSILAFVVLTAIVWIIRVRRDREMPRWQLGFPILVAFLLSNKVYSPQYGLWLLPWFALSLPSLPLFVAFELADVAVFVTRFGYFGYLAGGANGWTKVMSVGYFQIALLARAAVLFVCLGAFALRRSSPTIQTEPAPGPAPEPTPEQVALTP